MDKYLKALFTLVYIKKKLTPIIHAYEFLNTSKSIFYISSKFYISEYQEFKFTMWKRGSNETHYVMLDNKIITETSCPACLFAENFQIVFSKLNDKSSKKENCIKQPFNINKFCNFFEFTKEQILNEAYKRIYSYI